MVGRGVIIPGFLKGGAMWGEMDSVRRHMVDDIILLSGGRCSIDFRGRLMAIPLGQAGRSFQ